MWKSIPSSLRVVTIIALSILLLILLPAGARMVPLMPMNGSVVFEPPRFDWQGPSFENYFLYTLFPYQKGEYYPFGMQVPESPYSLPVQWWDHIHTDTPCYWIIAGYNVSPLDY